MTALRWLKRLLTLLLLLLVAVFLGGPLILSSEFGRARVERALARGLGREVAIGGLDVGMFFRSLEASGVRMGHPDGFPPGDTVAIESMQIDCGLRDLFEGRVKGRVVGTGVALEVLKKGEHTTLEGLGGKGGERKTTGETPPLDLAVDLEECDFTYRDLDTKETTKFEGIAVHAHLTDDAAEQSGRILVTMRELRRDPVVVRDLELGVRADGSVLVLDKAEGTLAGGGSLTAQGRLSLQDASAWSARLDAKHVSLDGSLVPVVATFWPFAASAGGNLEGLFTAGFDLRGSGVTWAAIRPTLSGEGEIRLTRLRLPAASVLGRVAKLIEQDDDASLGLNDAGAQFRIGGGWVDFNRLSASGRQARYDLRGRVSLDGRLDLKLDALPLMKLVLSASVYRDISRYTKELPIHVRGTTTKPALALPDMDKILQDAARARLVEEGKKKLDDELKKALEKIR